jgi:hypothetical protein
MERTCSSSSLLTPFFKTIIMAKTPHNCECKKEKPRGYPPRGLSSNGSKAVFHPEATGFGPPGAQRYASGDRADAHKKEKETSVCKLRLLKFNDFVKYFLSIKKKVSGFSFCYFH